MIRKFFIGLVINIVAIYFCQYIFNYLFNDFYIIGSPLKVFQFVFVLTLLNLLIKPILKFFFAPLIFLTLGIFSLIINIIILKIAISFVPILEINSSLVLIGSALIISLLNSILGK